MTKFDYLMIVFLSFAAFQFAIAQDPSDLVKARSNLAKQNKIVMVKQPEKTVHLLFPDGREAEVFRVEGPATESNIYPFDVFENTCSDYRDGAHVAGRLVSLTCRFETPQIMVGNTVLWTKNPDHSKIGHRVQVKGNRVILQDVEDVDALNYLLSVYDGRENSISPAFRKNIKLPLSMMPRIVCDDYRWIPNNQSRSIPKPTLISRWSSEAPQVNPETKTIELRTAADTFDIHLTPTRDNKLLFTFDGHYFKNRSQNPDSVSYYLGVAMRGIGSLIPSTAYDNTQFKMQLGLTKTNGDVCYISLAPKNPDQPTYGPRVSGSVDLPLGQPGFQEFTTGSQKPYVYPKPASSPNTEEYYEDEYSQIASGKTFINVLEKVISNMPPDMFQ